MNRSHIALLITIFTLAHNSNVLASQSPAEDMQQRLTAHIKKQQQESCYTATKAVLWATGATGLGICTLGLLKLAINNEVFPSILVYPSPWVAGMSTAFCIKQFIHTAHEKHHLDYLKNIVTRQEELPPVLTSIHQQLSDHKTLEQSCHVSWNQKAVLWGVGAVGFGISALATLPLACKSAERPGSLAVPSVLGLAAFTCAQRSLHNINNIDRMKQLECYRNVLSGALSS